MGTYIDRANTLPDNANKSDFYNLIDNARPITIADDDLDTKIQVEESIDEDIIRFDTDGTEQIRLSDGVLRPSLDNDIDLGASGAEFKDLYIDGTANIDSLVADSVDINGGTIDGVTIGGESAAAASFTALSSTGQASLNSLEIGGGGAIVTTIEDNDSLGTSDTKLCTQGNVKAYVDDNIPSANQRVKGWIQFVGNGTTINDSYNVASLTDIGTGHWTVVWDIDFTNDDYAVVATADRGNGDATFCNTNTIATTGVEIYTKNSGGNVADCDFVSVIAIGDQ